VHARVGGARIEFGSPRQQLLAAILGVDAGRPVPTEALVERLWGPDAPSGARQTLYTYLTRLRRTIERMPYDSGPRAALVRRTGGYLLDVDPDQVDLHRFRRLIDQSGRLPVTGEPPLRLLREAIGLWRGPALAGLPGEWAERMRGTWHQQQVTATLLWAAAELDSGDPAAVVAPLADLIAEQPLLEPAATLQIRALAAAGRTVDALACYDAMRGRLSEELGADPSPVLQAVHQAVLRGELHPAAGSAPAVAAGSAPVARPAAPTAGAPAQLPADNRAFTGRQAELATLDSFLDESAGVPTAVVISAIGGMAGVGKTTLAVHWAHRVAGRFPDGQLYANLRGFHPAGQVLDPGQVIRGFLDALGVPAGRIPAELDALAAFYRSELAGKRVLILLDNARDAEQVRPLLPGAPTAAVVVTSRDRLAPLLATDSAHPLTLDLLSGADAHRLLERRLGADRIAAEPRAVEQIVSYCARLPLALAIVAARGQTGIPLATLAAELTDARGRLGALDAGDATTELRAVFSWSYAALSTPAARLFRRLGLHPGPDMSAAAAASLTGAPLAETRRLLTELTRACLLREHSPGRYAFHDLLGAYATELSHSADPAGDRRAAIARLLDHYTHAARAADRLLDPARDPIPIQLDPSDTPEPLADSQAALDWLTVERPALLAAQRLAADSGFDARAWQLAWAMDTFLHRRGQWADLTDAWHTGAVAATRLGEHTAAAYAHRELAWVDIRQGRYDQARRNLRRALELVVETGDAAAQANVHHALGYLWIQLGMPERALVQDQQALDFYRTAGDRRGEAVVLNSIGWCHVQLGNFTEALASCRLAVNLHLRNSDRVSEAAAWDSCGYAHHHLGEFDRAAECYQHALDMFRDLGDRNNEAVTLTHLGDAWHAAGDTARAADAWQRALAILVDVDDPYADDVRDKLDTAGVT
jgi:DNA-binding SARP family transcriptional activator/tetratricopeptide (TPR) repeat protein